jgi:uncharacterized delta-60 repeat protein
MKDLFKSLWAALVVALCIGGISRTVWCASGDLDPSFGNGGKFLLADGNLHAVAFDNNTGAIESVGNAADGQLLIRTVAGQLDPQFGHGGVVVNPVTSTGVGMVILSDSRTVTAGSGRNLISLSRYEVNGAPDTSFGTNGTVFRQIPLAEGRNTVAKGLAIQPDGKFLIVGYVLPNAPVGQPTNMFLARFNFDGTTDDSFGTDGLVVTDLDVTDGNRGRVGVLMRAVGLQSNGDIVVVGSTRRFPAQNSIIARFLPDGSLDSSFGNHGIAENGCTLANAVAINSASGINTDDRIVATGTRGFTPCVFRLNPDGGLDSSFNGNGVLFLRPPEPKGELNAVIVSDGSEGPSGQIVVGGLTDTVPHSVAKFMLARINPDGSLDSTFGNHGIVTTTFSHGSEGSVVQGLTFYPGTIVATGFSTFSEEIHAAMARYLQ